MDQAQKIPSELLDKYRDVNVDLDGWWEYVYEHTTESLMQIGFEPDNMHFSGFWSQGDGASFTGRVFEWDLFLHELDPKGERYPMLRKVENKGFALERISHSYVHENTVCVGDYFADEWPTDTDNEAMDAVHDVWNEKLNQEIETFETAALEYLRSRMRELYRDLEAEYDYLTSDEQVAEWIESNCPDELEEYRESQEAA